MLESDVVLYSDQFDLSDRIFISNGTHAVNAPAGDTKHGKDKFESLDLYCGPRGVKATSFNPEKRIFVGLHIQYLCI